MFCPYSLSIPGGVQMQVMGLARELREAGVKVRVLGPCDGPPPATFVTPLGNSLPTSANGSIAPLAPDPAASLRTIRALFDEQFDVIHVHEPFTPGPTMTAVIVQPSPIVGTFHAAGHSTSYEVFGPLIRRWSRHLAHRAVVSVDALALIQDVAPGDYELLYNGVELPRYRCGALHPTDGPTIFFCGRHEERKGLEVLLRAMSHLGPEVRLWVGSSGPESERLRAEYSGDHRIEWLGRLTDDDKLDRLRGADVFCAPSLHGESFGVVLIEAMAAGTAIVASSLDGYLATWPPTARMRCSSHPATHWRSPMRCDGCSSSPSCEHGSSAPASSTPSRSRWPAWRRTTPRCTAGWRRRRSAGEASEGGVSPGRRRIGRMMRR